MSLLVFDGRPEACRVVHRAGDLMCWHWLAVIFMATRGYSIDFLQ